ncbi:hypothetical protein GTL21_002382 [Salmonella enterica]|nr:hypothetical protein [Salmonella enterica]
METVIDALKAMGKATAREIAARLKIEPVEALTMLREQEESGAVTFINGYWDIATDDAPVPKFITAPAVTPKKQYRCVAKLLSRSSRRPSSHYLPKTGIWIP